MSRIVFSFFLTKYLTFKFFTIICRRTIKAHDPLNQGNCRSKFVTDQSFFSARKKFKLAFKISVDHPRVKQMCRESNCTQENFSFLIDNINTYFFLPSSCKEQTFCSYSCGGKIATLDVAYAAIPQIYPTIRTIELTFFVLDTAFIAAIETL